MVDDIKMFILTKRAGSSPFLAFRFLQFSFFYLYSQQVYHFRVRFTSLILLLLLFFLLLLLLFLLFLFFFLFYLTTLLSSMRIFLTLQKFNRILFLIHPKTIYFLLHLRRFQYSLYLYPHILLLFLSLVIIHYCFKKYFFYHPCLMSPFILFTTV